MSRSTDKFLLTARYRKRVNFEIRKKMHACGAPEDDLICGRCDKPIMLGTRIHVQRSLLRVQPFHQGCWDKQFYGESD